MTQPLDKDTRRDSVRKLWETCFSDNPEFLDLYFDRVYSDELNFCLEKDGQVVSALQSLPYRMACERNRFNVRYLSGVATLPEHRHKRYAEHVITQALTDAYNRHTPFALEIPAGEQAARYYQRLGFRYTFYRECVPLDIPQGDFLRTYHCEEITKSSPSLFMAFHNREITQARFAVIHNRTQFDTVIQDWLLAGHRILACRKQSRIAAIAFVRPDHEAKACYLYNLPSILDESYRVLLHQTGQIYPGYRIYAYRHQCREGIPYAQLRIVHAERALALYATLHPTENTILEIHGDNLLPENNKVFHIQNGRCRKAKNYLKPDMKMTVGKLAQWILEDEHPYMSLMLE